MPELTCIYQIRTKDVIFKKSGLELYLSFLNKPIALFSFILTWDNCLLHCKCSFKSTSRYLTNWVDISRFPWSLSINEKSSFRLFGRNIISSVFCTFRNSLFARSQYERFYRYLFNCLVKASKEDWLHSACIIC